MKEIKIAGATIGPGEEVFIIGEIGVNHNGDPELAMKLIDSAAEAGLDAVKFQSFKAELLVARGTSKTSYQVETTGSGEDQYEMLRSLELSTEDFRLLKEHAGRKGLAFISTPYDPDSVRELVSIGVEALKISSADLEDALLLRAAAAAGLPVLLSTGMSTLDQVRRSVRLLRAGGAGDIILMHCVSLYPAPEREQNLRFIETLYEEFDCPVGYSDHTTGTGCAPLAVARGACVIEKHFTLDRRMEGPDHRASLDPDGMRRLVELTREAESILGQAMKQVGERELANARLMRKSLVFAEDLPRGTVLSLENLASRRPAGGASPMSCDGYVGRRLSRDVKRGERLREDHFEGEEKP